MRVLGSTLDVSLPKRGVLTTILHTHGESEPIRKEAIDKRQSSTRLEPAISVSRWIRYFVGEYRIHGDTETLHSAHTATFLHFSSYSARPFNKQPYPSWTETHISEVAISRVIHSVSSIDTYIPGRGLHTGGDRAEYKGQIVSFRVRFSGLQEK